MAILDLLEAGQGFTAAERELASYLLDNADKVVHMGIGPLALATCKSNSTIINLCRKVGATGWRDFRVRCASDLAMRRRDQSDVDPNIPFLHKQPTAQLMSNVASLERSAIDDCLASVDVEQIDALADAIHAARNIILYARGDSFTASFSFATLMAKIGVTCVDASQYRFVNESAFHATPDDLALFVTYSGGSIKYFDTSIVTLKSRGCPLGIVTSYIPAADRFSGFTYPVIVPHGESHHGKVASFYSMTCLRYALNCVYSAVFTKDYETNLRDKELFERLEPDMTVST